MRNAIFQDLSIVQKSVLSLLWHGKSTMSNDSTLDIPDELKIHETGPPKPKGPKGTSHKNLVTEDPVERPWDGQKYFIFNMLSPLDPNQKCDVHAFRILACLKTEEEVKKAGVIFTQRDPRFNIYQGEFGRFMPWIFDPSVVVDAETQHKEMRKLLDDQEHQQQEAEDHFYDRIMAEKMSAHKARFAQKVAQEEGRGDEAEEANKTRGNAVSAQYNIRQLTNVCKKRLEELKFWKDRYAADFSDEDRAHADAYDYPPDADVAPMFTV